MQKKSTLLAILIFTSLIGMAQFKKGTVSFNFDIGDIQNLQLRNRTFHKNNHLSFNTGAGYFIKNNWELGVGFQYGSLRINDSTNKLYNNSRTIGINVYSNYYFGKRKLKPYISFRAGLEETKGKQDFFGSGLQNYIYNKSYISIGGGLNWNINSRFSLFTELAWKRSNPFNLMGHGEGIVTIGARFFIRSKKN